jgi:hypothetical protein
LAVKPAWGEHFPTITTTAVGRGSSTEGREGIEDAQGRRWEIYRWEKWIIEP